MGHIDRHRDTNRHTLGQIQTYTDSLEWRPKDRLAPTRKGRGKKQRDGQMGRRERRGGRERLGGRKQGQKDSMVFLLLHAKSKDHTQAQISLLSVKAAALDVLS